MAKLTFLTKSAQEMFGVVDDEDDETENIESCQKVQNTLSDIYSRNNAPSPYPAASPSISPKHNAIVTNLEETSQVSSSDQTHICPLGQGIENFDPEKNSSVVVDHDDEAHREVATQITATDQLEEGSEKPSFEAHKEHINTKIDDSEKIQKHEASEEPAEATHPAPPPPPPRPSPPIPPSKGSETIPPPPPPPPLLSPVEMTKGAPPPPPPLNLVKIVRLKRAASKLKRSSQMSALYRHLKGKVEGISVKAVKGTSLQKKSKIGASPNGKEGGMAEALTEITKRSTITTIYLHSFISPFSL